ncbi:hypothetical protein AAC387_Pa02g5085 [Persea americana]
MAFARVAIVDEAAYFVGGVGNLSSLMVPPMPFSARQDAIELYKSFKAALGGSLFGFDLGVFNIAPASPWSYDGAVNKSMGIDTNINFDFKRLRRRSQMIRSA